MLLVEVRFLLLIVDHFHPLESESETKNPLSQEVSQNMCFLRFEAPTP